MKTVKYRIWDCSVIITTFVANKRQNKCIILKDVEDGLQVAKANVFLEGLKPNEVAIDINNCGVEMIHSLQDAEIIGKILINEKQSGYCTYPVYELMED